MMERRECDNCRRLYCEGFLIATDWAYWDRSEGQLVCPECRGIDVVAEIEAVINAGEAQ